MIFKIELKSLPFELTKEQVFYVENEYNEKVNRYIQFNYDEICKAFSNKGLQFCYLPKLKEELAEATDVIDFYAPYKKTVSNIEISSSLMLDYMLRPENKAKIGPALLFLDDSCNLENDTVIFKGVFLDEAKMQISKSDKVIKIANKMGLPFGRRLKGFTAISEIAEEWGKNRKDEGIRFRITGGEPVPTEDDFDDIETKELIRNLKATADLLEKKGIERYLLQLMVSGEKKLSRIKVTKNFRLFFMDYDNREILMGPMEKAFYLLYLKHPEGIEFKRLPEYHDELLAIYLKLKNGNDTVKVRNSIRKLVTYGNNEPNTCCSRINKILTNMYDWNVSKHYCIIGTRGEKRTVEVGREMVVWEESF